MKHNLFLGVSLTLIGSAFYSAQTALIKLTGDSLPPLPVIIFIQSLVSLALILPFIAKKMSEVLNTKQAGLQLGRTLLSLLLSYVLFYAIQKMPLVNAMLLANTAPLMVPFLAYLFMSQKINHHLWLPVVIGFLGVFLVLHPDSEMFNIGSGLALLAAAFMGGTVLAVRQLSKTDSMETTAFYFFLFSSAISGIVAISFWEPITLSMLGLMVMIGVLYFLTQCASMSALQFAPAQLVSTLLYSNIIYTTVISIIIWGAIPSVEMLVGMCLIVCGGMLCIYVTHKTHIKNRELKKGSLQYAQDFE